MVMKTRTHCLPNLRRHITTRRFTGGESRTGGDSFPFCQDILSPFINLSPFSVTLYPNESMSAPSRRNVLLRHHADPCLPFNVWHLYMGLCRYYMTFSRQVLKCCLLSYTLLLAIRGRVLCVVCRARHSSLPTRKKRMHTYYVALDSSPS